MMGFPFQRMRRLRRSQSLRKLVAETRLHPADFVYPLFVSETASEPESIPSLPGISLYPVDKVAAEAKRAFAAGIPAVLLFGTPAKKDATGSTSLEENGIVQQAVSEIKNTTPGLVVIADVCLCEYTDHGHCGIIRNNSIDNDATIDVLARQALSFAKAGVDMVAPSDMMDGRVGAIRAMLDNNGYYDIAIMSYSAKYCSAFYGPFREAAGSAPQFGDRKTYQMDPANGLEALKEISLDIEEGADIIMVKPALAYLDIIAKAKSRFQLPVAAYNVSGEYSIMKAGELMGWVDAKELIMETLISIKRAGADLILTYSASDVARELNS